MTKRYVLTHDQAIDFATARMNGANLREAVVSVLPDGTLKNGDMVSVTSRWRRRKEYPWGRLFWVLEVRSRSKPEMTQKRR